MSPDGPGTSGGDLRSWLFGPSTDPDFEAFDQLMAQRAGVGLRGVARNEDLVQPMHQEGPAFGWEVKKA